MLTGRCAVKFAVSQFRGNLFAGKKNKAESAVDAARSFRAFAPADGAFLKLPQKAHSIQLEIIFFASAIDEHVPDLLLFFLLCYNKKSFMVHGSFVLNSKEVFHQGDPIATLGFCLSLHQNLLMVCSHFCREYLDDGSSGDNIFFFF